MPIALAGNGASHGCGRPGNACVPPASIGGSLAVPFAGGTRASGGPAVPRTPVPGAALIRPNRARPREPTSQREKALRAARSHGNALPKAATAPFARTSAEPRPSSSSGDPAHHRGRATEPEARGFGLGGKSEPARFDRLTTPLGRAVRGPRRRGGGSRTRTPSADGSVCVPLHRATCSPDRLSEKLRTEGAGARGRPTHRQPPAAARMGREGGNQMDAGGRARNPAAAQSCKP